MEQQLYQKLKDDAFQAKTKHEWDIAMQNIKDSVANDEPARQSLRKYCVALLQKKKTYWEKQKARPQWTAKPKPPVFSDETQHAIQRMCNAIAAYYEKQANQQ